MRALKIYKYTKIKTSIQEIKIKQRCGNLTSLQLRLWW